MHRWSFSSDRNLQGLPWLIAVFLVLFLIEPRVVFDGTGRASQHWGPAAYAQEDEDDDVDEETPTPDEIDNMADPGGLPSTVEDGETVRPVKKASAKKKTAKERAKPAAKATKKAVKRPKPKSSVKRAKAAPAKKTTTKPVRRPKKAVEESSAPETSEDEEPADDSESAYAEEDDGAEESREEAAPRDPVRANATARELAIRKVGLAQVTVTRSARRYVPKDMEKSLRETLIQDLNSRSYFSVAPLKGVARMTASDRALAGIQRKEGLEGVLVLQIGLEEIYGFLASSSGAKVRAFRFRYLVGELKDKQALKLLSDRIVEGIVRQIPYRGFVTSVARDGTATINLGSTHFVKDGDVIELFEFRQRRFSSTNRFLLQAKVKKVLSETESQIELLDRGSSSRIEPFAKVSFNVASSTSLAATDHNVVTGQWWFAAGGEIVSFGAESVAQEYESRVFKVNSAPFGYFAAGNDMISLRGSFGSARSETETLNFVDVTGLYSFYQEGGAQSAWKFAGGVRVLSVNVVPIPVPGFTTGLESTTIVAPMAEFRYHYVPKGRLRLVGSVEAFWPVYAASADAGASIFAFGGGVGAAIQLMATPKLGLEVGAKIRYLRRPIEGQNGVQDRHSNMGAGLIFSF